LRKFALATFLVLACLLPVKPAHAATTTIVVNAYGTATANCLLFLICSYTYPTFDLYVNGVKTGSTQTTSNSNQNFSFTNVTIPTTGNINIDIHYTNDLYCSLNLFSLIVGCNGNRNLVINSVKIGNETISPSGNTVDLGSTYVQATDGINTTTYSTGVLENGALRLSTNYTNCCTVPPATLIAEYHFDETTWNGTTNETKDSA
jgi:hypothetical protein